MFTEAVPAFHFSMTLSLKLILEYKYISNCYQKGFKFQDIELTLFHSIALYFFGWSEPLSFAA